MCYVAIFDALYHSVHFSPFLRRVLLLFHYFFSQPSFKTSHTSRASAPNSDRLSVEWLCMSLGHCHAICNGAIIHQSVGVAPLWHMFSNWCRSSNCLLRRSRRLLFPRARSQKQDFNHLRNCDTVGVTIPVIYGRRSTTELQNGWADGWMREFNITFTLTSDVEDKKR